MNSSTRHLGNRYQYTDKNGFVSTFTHNSINQYDQVVIDYPLVPDETRYFDYDNNGNLTDDGMDDLFEYDYRNRLISADIAYGDAVAYTYDALGRRIRKVVDNQTTWFYYDLSGQVMAEYEQTTGNNPVLARSFVYGNGIDEILAMFRAVHEGDLNDWQAFLDFCDAWLSTTGQGNFNARSTTLPRSAARTLPTASVWDTPSFRSQTSIIFMTPSVRFGLIGGRYNRETDRVSIRAYGRPSNSPVTSAASNPYRFAGYHLQETGFTTCETEPTIPPMGVSSGMTLSGTPTR
jgi:YD repeat-containing protein